ncbi:hypothetical protein ACO22_03358 [Paracoccidioides brasiliensis]|uniref:Uncharacterized protein n=1 Tax=Paracoccidioides brasiliensis TaxID=121759 RepID=A0A1D2JG26_PARBR|nr:hypothetical protein ACO22_03358 [Paracoccidioides brasiliensis]
MFLHMARQKKPSRGLTYLGPSQPTEGGFFLNHGGILSGDFNPETFSLTSSTTSLLSLYPLRCPPHHFDHLDSLLIISTTETSSPVASTPETSTSATESTSESSATAPATTSATEGSAHSYPAIYAPKTAYQVSSAPESATSHIASSEIIEMSSPTTPTTSVTSAPTPALSANLWCFALPF